MNIFKHNRMIISIFLIIVGIALLAWCSVGQMIAQFNYDGQHIEWRTINDPSLFGMLGIIPLGLGLFLFAGAKR